MTLDDRMRGTFQRRLHDVQDSVDVADRPFQPNEIDLPTRLLVVGAAACLLIGGLFALNRLTTEGPSVEAADGSESQEPAPGSEDESDVQAQTPTSSLTVQTAPTSAPDPNGSEDGDDSTGTTTTTPSDTPATTGTTTAEASTDSTTETSTSTTGQPPTTDVPGPSPGVANDVCPSGSRAELEWAALRYVGDSRGWGRKDDLVDEQDGPFYFEAWEPNFAEPVTVEILLEQPVLATEIRVAQDPFNEVGGSIFIEVLDEEIAIALSGTDGWRSHTFPEPVLVERFTVRRQSSLSNIMEVLVCTA